MRNSQLKGNYVNQANGGGFYSYSGTNALYNITATKNTGYLSGGAFYFGYASVTTIADSNFHHNAAWYGSAMYLDNSTVTLLSSTIAHNVATDNSPGAGIYNSDGIANVSNTQFLNNTAVRTPEVSIYF